MNCPCGTGKTYVECCQPYHDGEADAPTPEALMRSRYAAYALKLIDYLEDTLDPQTSEDFDREATRKWAEESTFEKLEVLGASEEGNKGFVEFKAHFVVGAERHCHHEKSRFRKQAGRWYFREGRILNPEP